MSAENPGLARLTYRRLRSASGVTDLDEIEGQLAAITVAADENTALGRSLAEVLDRLESSLVPLLEARVATVVAAGEAPTQGVSETVNHDIAPPATDQ